MNQECNAKFDFEKEKHGIGITEGRVTHEGVNGRSRRSEKILSKEALELNADFIGFELKNALKIVRSRVFMILLVIFVQLGIKLE